MIITPIDEGDTWTCLARRGMLSSETESIELWRLDPGQELRFGEGHGVDEIVVVLSGSVEISGKILNAAMVAFVPEGLAEILRAHEYATVLSARGVPGRLAALLPPRAPELPKRERAI